MARPTLFQHRKLKRLARALGSPLLAVGALEFLWHSAYESGNAFLGDADDVEAAANWGGERGALCKALLDAGGVEPPGFIEQVPDQVGKYQVHDLFDHAPDYVRKRREREQQREKSGRSLSEVRAAAGRLGANVTNAKKSRAVRRPGKRAANGRHVPPGRSASGETPAPAPAPAPALPPPTPLAPPRALGAPDRELAVVVVDTQEAWEALQRNRLELGLLRENAPPLGFEAWLREARVELAGIDVVPRLACAHKYFLGDDDFRARGWPTRVFITREIWLHRVPAPNRPAPQPPAPARVEVDL